MNAAVTGRGIAKALSTPSALPPPLPPVIVARGLTKRFGAHAAVDGIDLEIGAGEVFGLLGPNGAGKTTTINMLVTILSPTAGTATVAGHDVARQPAAVREHVGIVFQEPSLDSILTGRENLALHARLYGVARSHRQARIEEMLELVGLEKRADSLVRTYSGGMKRRLEIARGLLHRPAVLFLDEPTLGLDVQTREVIWEHIRHLARELGTTIVLTTHYMAEADALCDRVGIIDQGRIVALGAPADLKAQVGGDRVRLRLAPGRRADFSTLPFVRAVEEKEGQVWLTVESAQRYLAEIVRAAGEVSELEVRSPTLEDVFIHHTGRGIREEATDQSPTDAWMKDMVQGGNR